MAFRHDLFISYGWLDDRSVTEGGQGWVSRLHHALNVRVGQLLGREPRIWRDAKLQGNDVFSDVLLDSLPEAALLVAVVSPRYTTSEWCVKEVQEFFRAAEGMGGVRVGNKLRVFKVVKTPVPREQEPAELVDLLGYEFFLVDPQSQRARELGDEFGDEAKRHYLVRLDDLANDISQMLRSLEIQTPEARPLRAERLTVFLAEVASGLKEARESIRRDLLRRGHEVLPDRRVPTAVQELEPFLRDCLARSRLAIHLIGEQAGFIPEGTDRSILEIQHELALERTNGDGAVQLVWMPPGLETGDERQQRFIDRVKADPRGGAAVDHLQVELEDLTTAIDDTIAALTRPPAIGEREGEAGQGAKQIFLICDAADGEGPRALEDLLFERGFEVVRPVFEGEEQALREDFEQNLRLCDAALVYYGAGSELWLRSKLRELRKSAALGRERPMAAQAVYVAPPINPGKERLRSHAALVIRQADGLDAETLEPFLEKIS